MGWYREYCAGIGEERQAPNFPAFVGRSYLRPKPSTLMKKLERMI